MSRLIIVGGSARAAAFAALRAGFQPFSYDLFADLDTKTAGPVQRIRRYPGDLPQLLNGLEAGPVMYVGGMENHPDVLERISQQHALWGVSPAVLRQCRSFPVLADVLRLARAPIAEWRTANDPPPPDGNWMLRPLAGSGGQGVAIWDAETAARVQGADGIPLEFGFQQRIHGKPYSALFIASPDEGDVQFVGVMQQLVGEAAFGAPAHIWCGNIGPVALPVGVEQLVRRVGNILKWKIGLQGIYGLDFLVDGEDRPWITEVNPRYPASAELLEWATLNPLLWQHARCFGYTEHPLPGWAGADLSGQVLGKAILYAEQDGMIAPAVNSWLADVSPWRFPTVSDLPAPGTIVSAGQPLCTVFAHAARADQCFQELVQHAVQVRQSLIQPV